MLELEHYTLEPVRTSGPLLLFRGFLTIPKAGRPPSILVQAPATDAPEPATVRSLHEAYALRSELDAAFVVRPLALVHSHGRPMVILEDPQGTSLDMLLKGPMDVPRFLHLAIRVALALDHLHSRGFLHKDITPANILVNAARDQARLMGLGAASRLLRERQVSEGSRFLVGTLAYMAPEQTGRMNRSIDSRSDLYGLGVTFYEMLTGTLPFATSDPMELVHSHLARQPATPCETVNGVPPTLSAIVMKLLAKTAEDRYQTAAGLAKDLRRCLTEWDTQREISNFPLGDQDALQIG